MRRDILETLNLTFLGQQCEQRVERQIDEREGVIDADIREVDLVTSMAAPPAFSRNLGHHLLRDINS